jgi:hypothetical protein
MTTLTLVLSCLSLVLSLVSLGYARTTARRWRKYTRPTEPKPICGCEHHASFHDDEGCHFNRDELGRTAPDCGCKKYMGPEPLPEAYLP